MLPRDILENGENGFSQFLFYDCEVFLNENLVVFKDIDKNDVAIFRNGEWICGPCRTLAELIDGKILVGYNNYAYDDYVLSAMIAGTSPYFIKAVNDSILSGTRPRIAVNPKICSLDCFQQIKYKSSLKKVEANIGQSIDESQVDFNLDRQMTLDELESTLQYCSRDVDATIDVFKMRWGEYFKPKLSVVSMLPEDQQERFLRYNVTTITAQVLTQGKKVNRWASRRFSKTTFSEDYSLPIFENTPDSVIEMWRSEGVSKMEIDSLDCVFTFGSGGLHGTNKTGQIYKERPEQKILLLDVASMYPNIILQIEGLGKDSTKIYKGIVEKRLSVKHTDPVLATALKLVVNSTYGLLKNQYSNLYNPPAADSVCIYGQAALYDLCVRLHDAGYEIINANTDGVCFYGDPKAYLPIQEAWEEKFGLTLELSEYDMWVQRDVNNYVAVSKSGKVKVKGGDTLKYHDPSSFKGDLLNFDPGLSWSGTNSNGIISRAIVNAIVYNKPTEETIMESLSEPLLFQIVLQAGNTYRGVIDTNGSRGYQKVNRVFAAHTGPRLLKERPDGATNEFPDMPEHMLVFNGDLADIGELRPKIDLEYYNTIARDRLSKWPNPWIA